MAKKIVTGTSVQKTAEKLIDTLSIEFFAKCPKCGKEIIVPMEGKKDITCPVCKEIFNPICLGVRKKDSIRRKNPSFRES
jgi:ribosomal protein S27E